MPFKGFVLSGLGMKVTGTSRWKWPENALFKQPGREYAARRGATEGKPVFAGFCLRLLRRDKSAFARLPPSPSFRLRPASARRVGRDESARQTPLTQRRRGRRGGGNACQRMKRAKRIFGRKSCPRIAGLEREDEHGESQSNGAPVSSPARNYRKHGIEPCRRPALRDAEDGLSAQSAPCLSKATSKPPWTVFAPNVMTRQAAAFPRRYPTALTFFQRESKQRDRGSRSKPRYPGACTRLSIVFHTGSECRITGTFGKSA